VNVCECYLLQYLLFTCSKLLFHLPCLSTGLVSSGPKSWISLYCLVWPLQLFIYRSHKWHNFLKNSYWTQNVCCEFVWNFSVSEKNSVTYCHKVFIYLHIKYPSFLSDFKETCLSSTDLHVIFHENQSSGSQVIPCGLMDRQTDMMKLMGVVKTFVNMAKNVHFHELSLHVGPSLGIW
jgi:hypothetical protein